jgi:hypothetical protein
MNDLLQQIDRTEALSILAILAQLRANNSSRECRRKTDEKSL